MPLSAKILAALNVLMAGVFIYLASVDFQARQQWSQEVFRQELVLNGLPVDEADVGLKVDQQPTYDAKSKTWRLPEEDKDADRRVDRPLYADLGPDMLYNLFNDSFALDAAEKIPADQGGKDPPKTQTEEVIRLRDKLKADLDGSKNDQERRAKLKAFFLARARCARTLKERDDSRKAVDDKTIKTDQLQEQCLARFNDVIATGDEDAKRSVAERRADIANLLYSIDPSGVAHQRLMVIVGLRAFAMEADAQTLTLRDMAEKTHHASNDDRERFNDFYLHQAKDLETLAHKLNSLQTELETKDGQVKGKGDDIDKRKKLIEELLAKVDEAKKKTEESLAIQSDLEKKLFAIHKDTGSLIEANRKLERDIRILELGRSRGGSR